MLLAFLRFLPPKPTTANHHLTPRKALYFLTGPKLRSGVLSFLLCLGACRTGGTPPDAQAPTAEVVPVAPAAAALEPATQALPRVAPVPRDSQPVTLISGFSLNGPDECVPLKLAPEVACINRTEPLQAVCAQRQGALLRCDDCRVLCSRPALTQAPRAAKPSR